MRRPPRYLAWQIERARALAEAFLPEWGINAEFRSILARDVEFKCHGFSRDCGKNAARVPPKLPKGLWNLNSTIFLNLALFSVRPVHKPWNLSTGLPA